MFFTEVIFFAKTGRWVRLWIPSHFKLSMQRRRFEFHGRVDYTPASMAGWLQFTDEIKLSSTVYKGMVRDHGRIIRDTFWHNPDMFDINFWRNLKILGKFFVFLVQIGRFGHQEVFVLGCGSFTHISVTFTFVRQIRPILVYVNFGVQTFFPVN